MQNFNAVTTLQFNKISVNNRKIILYNNFLIQLKFDFKKRFWCLAIVSTKNFSTFSFLNSFYYSNSLKIIESMFNFRLSVGY